MSALQTMNSHKTPRGSRPQYRPIKPTDAEYQKALRPHLTFKYLTLDIHDIKTPKEMRTLNKQIRSDRAQLDILMRRIRKTQQSLFPELGRPTIVSHPPRYEFDFKPEPGQEFCLEETLIRLLNKVLSIKGDLTLMSSRCERRMLSLDG